MSVVQKRIERTLPTVRKFKCLPSEYFQKKKKKYKVQQYFPSYSSQNTDFSQHTYDIK